MYEEEAVTMSSAPEVKFVVDAKGGRPRPRVSVSAARSSGTAAGSPTSLSRRNAAQSTRTSSGRRESCLPPSSTLSVAVF